MNITVAICTWNRAALLDQTLERMKCLQIPEGVTWELLVVNNNCTDNTDAVIARHATALPLRQLTELNQGQSHARNCVIDNAKGDLLIWTDDDVLVDRGWLKAYLAAAARHPDAAFFGGHISPWFEIDPPQWITDNLSALEGYLVIRDLGEAERSFTATEAPFGANMAFWTNLQRAFRYDVRLGNVKNQNVAGEETDVFERLRSAGHYGVWVPEARVKHFVTRQRMEVHFFCEYSKDRGAKTARTSPPFTGPQLLGTPRWLWKELVANWLRYYRVKITTTTGWVVPLMHLMFTRGKIAEYRKLAQRNA